MSNGSTRFRASAIAGHCSGRLVAGSGGRSAAGISTDSRAIAPGQAFVALVGEKHDGHEFIPQAVASGASVVLAQRLPDSWILPDGVAAILVDDTARALLDLATWHRRRLRGTVLAVTGSCGKSSVKTMLAAILARRGRCCAAQRSFNNRIGVSLTLLEAGVDDDFVVLEMGTNHAGEIDELARCARPDGAIVTCIGDCHLEGLHDRQGVKEAKAELIPHLACDGLLALNADDDMCASLGSRFEGMVRTFGLSSRADVQPTRVRRVDGCTAFELWGKPFRLPFPGEHNVVNAAAALCVATWAGATLQHAREALAEVQLPPMRQEVRRLGGVTFLVDCYNSNPTAMRAALRLFLEEPCRGRRVVVCGDMLELGAQAPELHKLLGRAMALTQVEMLVAVGPMGEHLLAGWNSMAREDQGSMRFLSAQEAWRPLWDYLRSGDAVLLKGSRAMALEQVPDAIAERIGRRARKVA